MRWQPVLIARAPVISRSNTKHVCLYAAMRSISLCVHASGHLTFVRNLAENRFEKSRASWMYAVTYTNTTSSAERSALVTSSIFAYPRRTAGRLARTVEWGHRSVRRRRVESIKTSRKQVRSDTPGKFKRTFHRVVITRIRVARASALTLPKSFSWPRLDIPWRSEVWPSFLEFVMFQWRTTIYHLLPE